MSFKHKILLNYIKDLSVETPDAESVIAARDNISKYSLKLDLSSKILKNKMAASSGGPINNATNAIGPINNIVTISLEKSAITEENRAVSRAFLPLPCLVSGGPSNVVATEAPVPGSDTKIAGIDPPKIPPL